MFFQTCLHGHIDTCSENDSVDVGSKFLPKSHENYCWWPKSGVYPLRLVVEIPLFTRVFNIPSGFLAGFLNHQQVGSGFNMFFLLPRPQTLGLIQFDHIFSDGLVGWLVAASSENMTKTGWMLQVCFGPPGWDWVGFVSPTCWDILGPGVDPRKSYPWKIIRKLMVILNDYSLYFFSDLGAPLFLTSQFREVFCCVFGPCSWGTCGSV